MSAMIEPGLGLPLLISVIGLILAGILAFRDER